VTAQDPEPRVAKQDTTLSYKFIIGKPSVAHAVTTCLFEAAGEEGPGVRVADGMRLFEHRQRKGRAEQ
jgi:hypothetical protein